MGHWGPSPIALAPSLASSSGVEAGGHGEEEAQTGRRLWDGGEEDGLPGSVDHWSLTASPEWGLGSEEEDKSPISADPMQDLRRNAFPPHAPGGTHGYRGYPTSYP